MRTVDPTDGILQWMPIRVRVHPVY